jgi:hypothetical protein
MERRLASTHRAVVVTIESNRCLNFIFRAPSQIAFPRLRGKHEAQINNESKLKDPLGLLTFIRMRLLPPETLIYEFLPPLNDP